MRTLTRSAWDSARQAPVVRALSSVNGLGFSPYQMWAFRRADLTAFAPSPFLCDNGLPAIMAPVRTLSVTSFGGDRLVALALEALEPLLPSLAALHELDPAVDLISRRPLPGGFEKPGVARSV